MAYGQPLSLSFRQLVALVDKILRGAKPADVLVEQPKDFTLAISLNSARPLGPSASTPGSTANRPRSRGIDCGDGEGEPVLGYDRIVGALANLGYRVSDQTVGNVLRRHGIAPAPERKRTTTWAEFIRTHLALLAGTDFFTVEVPHVARPGDLLRSLLHPSPRRAHNAGCLKFDQTIATVTYPFHPLVGQSVSIVSYHEHGGTYHLVIRKPDGAKCLIPEWMTRPKTEAIRILSSPRDAPAE